MDAQFQFENHLEAGLWWTMALILGVAALRSRRWRVQALLTALDLVAFGGSDIVEAGTGAWWRPWWLLMWKVGCVALLLASAIRYYVLVGNKTRLRAVSALTRRVAAWLSWRAWVTTGVAVALIAIAIWSFQDELVAWRDREIDHYALDGLSAYKGNARLSYNRDSTPQEKYSDNTWECCDSVFVLHFSVFSCAQRGLINLAGPPRPKYTGWLVALPIWLIAGLLLLHPLIVGVWRWRHKRRGALNCRDCNYSLVGNVSGRCPECGRAME